MPKSSSSGLFERHTESNQNYNGTSGDMEYNFCRGNTTFERHIIVEVPDIDSITLNPSANINYASYTSVYGFISVMSEMIDANLGKKAADSPVITALKDESTDIVVNHRLAINICIV